MFWNRKPKKTDSEVPPPIPLGKGHPGAFDEPKNDLEVALLAVRSRQLETPKFIEFLFNANVFLAVPEGQFDRIDGTLKLKENPTVFTVTYPEYTALAIYTHESRLKPTHTQFPEFRYAISICAGNFILSASNPFGLVINPYWDVNLEWSANQITQIKKMIQG